MHNKPTCRKTRKRQWKAMVIMSSYQMRMTDERKRMVVWATVGYHICPLECWQLRPLSCRMRTADRVSAPVCRQNRWDAEEGREKKRKENRWEWVSGRSQKPPTELQHADKTDWHAQTGGKQNQNKSTELQSRLLNCAWKRKNKYKLVKKRWQIVHRLYIEHSVIWNTTWREKHWNTQHTQT